MRYRQREREIFHNRKHRGTWPLKLLIQHPLCFFLSALPQGTGPLIFQITVHLNYRASHITRAAPLALSGFPWTRLTVDPKPKRLSPARFERSKSAWREDKETIDELPPGPEGQVQRHVLWHVLRNAPRRASFMCSSFMCHLRAGAGGYRAWVAARRSILFFFPERLRSPRPSRARPSRVDRHCHWTCRSNTSTPTSTPTPNTPSVPSSAAPGFRRLKMTHATLNTFNNNWRRRWWWRRRRWRWWLCVVVGSLLLECKPSAPSTPNTKGRRLGQYASIGRVA